MEEIWKDIEGYQHKQVSNLGNVRTTNYYRTGKTKLLKQNKTAFGYMRVTFNNVEQKIHRLVGVAFVPKVEGKPFINHIDGDKTNNKSTNLEWCTQSENMQHAYRIGLQSFSSKTKVIFDNTRSRNKGEKSAKAHLTQKQADEIRLKYIKKRGALTNLAKQYSTTKTVIFNVVNNKTYINVVTN